VEPGGRVLATADLICGSRGSRRRAAERSARPEQHPTTAVERRQDVLLPS